MKTNSKLFRLVFSALMVALATVLSVLSIGLPFGGSITIAAMAPLVLVSQMYGFRWGLFTCSAYGLLQLVLGLDNFAYATTIWAVIAIILFDYVVAYAALSLSALTRNMKSKPLAAAIGALIGCFGRFCCHLVSGVVVWGQWADVTTLPAALQNGWFASEDVLVYSYSFFYNLGYMLPETIATVVVSAVLVALLAPLRKRADA